MANQPKKYKKFVATAATATLVASAIVPVASAASLSDIAGNTHEEAINALVDAKVISGYPDGTFKPNKTLTRSDVVKLLGKYLETEGYAPAADYATSPAFNDLKAGSNDELLKYASIVKEAGVFAGSNGNLLAGDKITRENMAITLVRMINTLKDVSLEEYVAAQDFKGDVKDLSVAKAEARSAIAVLDFYDITNPSVSNFNPKGDTTRGQFATFLHKTINADFAGASATTGTVKAINNTTVEVTFGKDIDDIKALKFAIEGLEVKDAVVKQTDKKTAVITTSAQEAGKAYTVTEGGKTIGKFTGISAVIPKSVSFTKYVEASKQGVIGKEVTLKATVAVEDGQSKAGVPVTFNIINSNTANEKKEVEVKTDENGVATYTYTRYYSGTDEAVAYATQKSSVYANAKVYWANSAQLEVSEINSGNDLANETKKTYKIVGDENSTYQVSIQENIGITPDKVTDVKVQSHGSNVFVTPFQFSTGANQFATVTTNAKGEGTFTVYGSNLSATPVVYKPESTNNKYTATALQQSAPTVKFSQVNRLALSVKAEGTASSAAFANVPTAYDTNSAGGREYTVTVTDKDGKLAPEGTIAYVTFEEGNIQGTVYFSTGTQNFVPVAAKSVQPITVGKEGKAKFRVAGTGNTTFVKPTVFLNTAGTANPVTFEKTGSSTDIFEVSEVTYFGTANVYNAELSVKDVYGRTVTTLSAGQDAVFTYQSVDQNGFPYRPAATTTAPTTSTVWVPVTLPDGTIGYKQETITNVPGSTFYEYTLAFDVTSTFGDAEVKDALGVTLLPVTQNLGTTKTYHVKSDANGKAIVRVSSKTADTVSVNVTGASNILPTQTASVNFINSSVVPDSYSGQVESYNSVTGKLKFVGKNPVDLYGSNILYSKGNEVIANYEAFVKLLADANGPVSITRIVKDGVTTFNIYNIASTGGGPVDTANPVTPVPPVTSTVEITEATAVGLNALSSLVGSYNYDVKGTAGTAYAGETVTLTFTNNDASVTKTATATVDAEGKFATTIPAADLFGSFTKVTASVTKAGVTTTSASKAIAVTETLN
jgi:trimeric autotransporter adhesin